MRKIPVVIFGDHIAAYGTIRALGPMGIPIYIVSQNGKGLSTKSRFVRKVLALKPNKANFMEEFNHWVFKEVGGDAVLMVAGDDDYLDALAKNYNGLLTGLKPTFPNWDIVKLVRQKRHTYKIAEQIGIPIPKTYYITYQSELEDILDKGIEINFPLLMKSEDSTRFLNKYKTKGIICNTRDEVIKNYDAYNGFFGQLLLQEMIPGEENLLFNFIGVFNNNSDPIAVFMNRKRRSNGQFLRCTLMESIWSYQVLEYSLKLLKTIGYRGYANPEYKFDQRDGLLKLVEINGRISLSNSHALRCSINLPLVMYKEALEGPLPKLEELNQRYSNNILWYDLIGDSLSAVRLLFERKLTVKDYLKSIRGSGYIFEPLNWGDPLPMVYSIKNYSGAFLKKLTRRLK